MAEEKLMTVPLRKYFLNAPKWRRTKKAANVLRAFVLKHTKAKDVKLSRWVNEHLWTDGAKNPPGTAKAARAG